MALGPIWHPNTNTPRLWGDLSTHIRILHGFGAIWKRGLRSNRFLLGKMLQIGHAANFLERFWSSLCKVEKMNSNVVPNTPWIWGAKSTQIRRFHGAFPTIPWLWGHISTQKRISQTSGILFFTRKVNFELIGKEKYWSKLKIIYFQKSKIRIKKSSKRNKDKEKHLSKWKRFISKVENEDKDNSKQTFW